MRQDDSLSEIVYIGECKALGIERPRVPNMLHRFFLYRSINRFCLIRNFAGWDGFDLWYVDVICNWAIFCNRATFFLSAAFSSSLLLALLSRLPKASAALCYLLLLCYIPYRSTLLLCCLFFRARNAMFKILGEDKEMVEQLQPEQMRAEVCTCAL